MPESTMAKMQVQWKKILDVANRYREQAEICLATGAYVAGLVCVRASLESALIARYLLELFDLSPKKIPKGITVDTKKGLVEGEQRYFRELLPHLKELIDQAFSNGLLTKSGAEAAHRIRVWGNKIHPLQAVKEGRLPLISHRNLRARLRDLEYVLRQLVRTL